MKKSAIAFLSVFLFAGINSTVVAQQEMPQNSESKDEEAKHNERVGTLLGRRGYGPQLEDTIVKSGLLAPSSKDVSDNLSFLKQSKTGLMRLLPREVYDTPEGKKRIQINGTGAYYSFFFVAHEYGYGSDIGLERDKLISGFAGADIGILTDLGEVDLASLKLNDPRLTFLLNYQPPQNEPSARVEQVRARDGFTLSGMTYNKSLPLHVGSTYVVRSIIYGRSDLLVAFTVTRKDEDGSAIIIWKQLKTYETPKLN